MAVSNSLQVQTNKTPKFSVAIRQETWQNLINNTLGDKERAGRFIAAITSAVAVNPTIQSCDAGTILTAALLGETMNLSPSPQLGHFYLVPYKQKAKKDRYGKIVTPERTVAQFQIGYKGLIQLALRSGYYKKLNVITIKQGELVKWDPFTEEITLKLEEDEDKRNKLPTAGYAAMFEYLNGFQKTIYWSKEKMLAHADRYSAAFSKETTQVKTYGGTKMKVSYSDYLAGNYSEDDEWLYSSFWYKDFDGMAHKTMLRQLISKWGIMSIELQKAFNADEATIGTDLSPVYSDTTENGQEDFASLQESVATDTPIADPATGEVINDAEDLPEGEF